MSEGGLAPRSSQCLLKTVLCLMSEGGLAPRSSQCLLKTVLCLMSEGGSLFTAPKFKLLPQTPAKLRSRLISRLLQLPGIARFKLSVELGNIIRL